MKNFFTVITSSLLLSLVIVGCGQSEKRKCEARDGCVWDKDREGEKCITEEHKKCEDDGNTYDEEKKECKAKEVAEAVPLTVSFTPVAESGDWADVRLRKDHSERLGGSTGRLCVEVSKEAILGPATKITVTKKAQASDEKVLCDNSVATAKCEAKDYEIVSKDGDYVLQPAEAPCEVVVASGAYEPDEGDGDGDDGDGEGAEGEGADSEDVPGEYEDE